MGSPYMKLYVRKKSWPIFNLAVESATDITQYRHVSAHDLKGPRI